MADSSDILGVLLDQQRVESPSGSRANRSFSKVRSVVQDYSRLISGHGYSFYSFPSPVAPVHHAKKPLIPMMISIVPPENYPTGDTTTREIPSPSTAEISLTSMRQRVTSELSSGSVTRVVPVDSQIAERVAELQEELDGASGERRSQLELEIDSLIARTPTMEVEVPVSTPEGRESQVRRTEAYLDGLQDRYDDFQRAARSSRDQLNELNTPITGPTTEERADPWARLWEIQDARERSVQGDLLLLREQARAMQELPPLFMYINPRSFSRTNEHIVSDGNKVRNGFSIEFWGEQQVTISASGSVGAFYVDTTDMLGRPSGGLAVSARRGSYAYQQFMALYQLYRSNAYVYNAEEKIALVGSVSIFYDGVIYTGSFNSFSISHAEDSPFSLSYSFDFTVRYREDLRRV